jgi:ABC-type multidrug transport system fused ATPase/permease subunit
MMTSLIDRYVYDVTRRLPEKSRPDVEKELRANIADMLPENASQEDITRVLTSLGDPAKLSEQYRARPRYLISPAVFDDYLTVLKLVIPILAVGMLVLHLFSTLTETPIEGSYGQVFASILAGTLSSLFSAVTNGFLWVTLAFALTEYFNGMQKKKDWTIKELPDIPPANTEKISRVETIINMVLSALFLVMMTRYQHLIAWFGYGISTPLFSSLAVYSYVPYLVALTACSWAVAAVKLYYGRWNAVTAALHSLNAIAWAIASVLFLRSPDTFNPGFIARAAEALKLDLAVMNDYWQRGILILSIMTIIGTAIDILTTIFKVRKGRILPDLSGRV